MKNQQLNNFEITFAIETDLTVQEFLYGKQIEKILNNNFALSNYTDKYETLFIIFQCFAPDNKYMQVREKSIFRHKKKVIELYTIVDYHLFKTADNTTREQLLITSLNKALENKIKSKTSQFSNLTKDIQQLLLVKK